MASPERQLPASILERASMSGAEFAWPLSDIPAVIEAARLAGLVSIGGQLQFLLPDGGTCECYWVEVDTFAEVPSDLPWPHRVDATARAALAQFCKLSARFKPFDEGRGFQAVRDFEAHGGDLGTIMKFVWHLEADPAVGAAGEKA